MPKELGELRNGQILNGAGIGRPITDESMTAFMEAFDRVMPSIVRLGTRQLPGTFYVGAQTFVESNPELDTRDRPAVEARIGEMVTSLCDDDKLTGDALQPIRPFISNLVVGDNNRLIMRIRDIRTKQYRAGSVIMGERSTIVKSLGMPQHTVHRYPDRVARPTMTMGLVYRNKGLVTNDRLATIRKLMREVTLDPIGVVTSA